MTSEELTCRIRVQKSQSTDEGTTPSEELTVLDLKDCPDIPTKTREKWADNLITIIAESEVADTLRPWDLLLGLDGTVSTLPVPAPKRIVALEYPARYRIPPNSLYGYDEKESMRRAESFALGSLLYEIETGRMPFESLSDSEVQRKYSAGDFPRDVSRLKLGSAIYSSWSWEFLEGSKKLGKTASRPMLVPLRSDRIVKLRSVHHNRHTRDTSARSPSMPKRIPTSSAAVLFHLES